MGGRRRLLPVTFVFVPPARRGKSRAVRRGLLSLAGFIATLSTDVSSQQKTSERGIELLSISFAAVTADGHPVTDLQADDVIVKIGGRTRAVRSVQMAEALPSVNAEAQAALKLPSPFGTNSIADAGTYVRAGHR